MTTSQGLDEIVLRSSPVVGSLCLAVLLTATPAVNRSPRALTLSSLTEQPRYAALYTCSSSTGTSVVVAAQSPLAEQLAKLMITMGEDRDISLLAYLCNVSKNTYYGWLKGEPIGPENRERLARTIEVLGDVSTRHRNLVAFLKAESELGSAAEQLRAGRFDVALGMSYMTAPPLSGRTSKSGRALRSVPAAAHAATAERLRNARRVRDVAREPNPAAYVEEDSESVALGSAIIVG